MEQDIAKLGINPIPKDKINQCFGKDTNRCIYFSAFHGRPNCLYSGAGAVKGSIPESCPLQFKAETPVLQFKPAHEPISKDLQIVSPPPGELQGSYPQPYENIITARNPNKTEAQRFGAGGSDMACPVCHFEGGLSFIGDDLHGRQNAWMCPRCRTIMSRIGEEWKPIWNPTMHVAEWPKQAKVNAICPKCNNKVEPKEHENNITRFECSKCNLKFSEKDNILHDYSGQHVLDWWNPIIINEGNALDQPAYDLSPGGRGQYAQEKPDKPPIWSPKGMANVDFAEQLKKPEKCPLCLDTKIVPGRFRGEWLCETCFLRFQDRVNAYYNIDPPIREPQPKLHSTAMSTSTTGGEMVDPPMLTGAQPPMMQTEYKGMEEDNLFTVKEWIGKEYKPILEQIIQFLLKINFAFSSDEDEITASEKQGIRGILINSFKYNQSIGHIAQLIQAIIGDYDRAVKIARTETVRAHSEGSLMQFKEMDVKKVQWFIHPDERLCPSCRKESNNGTKIFKLKDAEGAIPLHPNCRCRWSPILEF